MLRRRMNNWNTVSDQGIKCLERLSCVHTSGIGAFYTYEDIFRRTSNRQSGDTMMLVSRWNDKWKPSESPYQAFRRFLLCACWWRSHDVLFSVNSVHGLNCNVLLTAQWCAWMKRLWIINLTEAGCSLYPIPTSTTPISSGSATGHSRMCRTWMKRLLPIGTVWSAQRISCFTWVISIWAALPNG